MFYQSIYLMNGAINQGIHYVFGHLMSKSELIIGFTHANFATLYKIFPLKPLKRIFESTGKNPLFLGGFPGEAVYRLEA